MPERAVTELQGKNFVWVVGADNKATQRAVKVAPNRVGSDVIILEGLKAGERIVVEGVQKVREGAPVQAMAAPPADASGQTGGSQPRQARRSQARQGITVMADFFIRRPIVAMVIAILTVIVGLISLKRLPISEYPPVSPTMIQVTTTYRGAAAEAVMESVATPIESKVNGVDKLLYMQSYNANDGKLTLNVYFDVGTDVDIMQVNAQNRVGQAEAQLPEAVKQEGVVVNRSSPDILMVVGLNSPKGTYDAIFLGNYCDINLVDAIKRVQGVGDVKNFTAQDYSMRIWLRPDKLASLGITPQDIPNAIKEQNAQSPAGRIGAEPAPPGQEMQFNVRALGLLKDPKEFEEIIIRSNPDGSQVKIKDVGRVELGAQTYDLRARLNKTPAGAIGIYLAPGANAIETADNVKKILEDAKTRFPPDMAYDITLDSTLPIKASMEEIVHTLFEAVILVLIVVYVFLQSFRATIIPMCTVPVSLLGAFIMFPVLGFSVNVLTMFGLVLAIGIVVDDAIVVVEAVQHHLEHGKNPVEATRLAMKEVSGPVVAIGLVLCAVFVPVAFMGGVTGQLYSQFALTIAVAVVFSVINALTLSPALVRADAQEADAGTRPDREVLQVVQPLLRLGDATATAASSAAWPARPRAPCCCWWWWSAASGCSASSCPAGSFPTRTRAISSSPSNCPRARRSSAPTKCSSRWKTSWPTPKASARPWASPVMNILNSLNFPNSAMMFVGLEPWEERKSARAARQRPRARVDTRNSPPSPARARLLSARRRCRATATCPASPCNCRTAPAASSSNWPATSSNFSRSGRQAPGDWPRQHHLQSGDAAGEGRTGPREGAHAGRAGGQRLPDAANLLERTLRERLRPLRPRL